MANLIDTDGLATYDKEYVQPIKDEIPEVVKYDTNYQKTVQKLRADNSDDHVPSVKSSIALVTDPMGLGCNNPLARFSFQANGAVPAVETSGNSVYFDLNCFGSYLVIAGVFGNSVIRAPYSIAFAGGQTDALGAITYITRTYGDITFNSIAYKDARLRITQHWKDNDKSTGRIIVHCTLCDQNNKPIPANAFIQAHVIPLNASYRNNETLTE